MSFNSSKIFIFSMIYFNFSVLTCSSSPFADSMESAIFMNSWPRVSIYFSIFSKIIFVSFITESTFICSVKITIFSKYGFRSVNFPLISSLTYDWMPFNFFMIRFKFSILKHILPSEIIAYFPSTFSELVNTFSTNLLSSLNCVGS